jgi:LacI family transcriptional regulator
MQTDIVIVIDKGAAFGRQVLAGIGQYAQQHWCWNLTVVDLRAWTPEQILGEAAIAQVNGPALRQALKSCRAVVNVGDALRCEEFPLVRSDHREIGALGAEHFLERGFRHLAFFGWQERWYACERRDGFVAAAAKRNVQPLELMLQPDHQDPDAKWRQAERWLEALPRPCGLMACDDPCAHTVCARARKLKRRCPEEIAVLGVDNDKLVCDLEPVPLSSVALAGQRVGYEAASLLQRLLDGQRPPAQDVVIPPVGVVTRRSTDISPVTDELVARAMEYIRLHAADPANTQELLAHLGVTRRQLEQRFCSVMQRTPAAELRHFRIESAKQMLANTDVCTARVATTCGFGDGARLAKIFRREVGMTPIEYRRRTRLV